tara:strand:- start:249 stop:533 length:285 start_codon:yes stop_codon:yes gene_type:complete
MSKKNLTKHEIRQAIKKIGFSDNYSKKILNDLLNVLSETISKKDLYIKNFGKFKIHFKKQRLGRNPKTNEPYTISSRKSLSFLASKKIIDYLNS